MKKVDLTFGIPMYNAESYILELLSCFKDTEKFEYEIIIIDDGSSDNGYNICKKFKNKHLKLYTQDNMGVSTTRNNIINKANGKWITFVDADDIIFFEKYVDVFEIINNGKYDYAVNTKNSNIMNKIKNKSEKNIISLLIEKEIINSPWTKFYLVDKLKEEKVYFEKKYSLAEDLLFNLTYYNKCNNPYYFYCKMYSMRTINCNSLTRKFTKNKYEMLIGANDLCKKLNTNIEYQKALEYIRFRNVISCLMDTYLFGDKFDDKSYFDKINNSFKRKYFFLNTFLETAIYNFWFIMPSNIKQKFIKYLSKKK